VEVVYGEDTQNVRQIMGNLKRWRRISSLVKVYWVGELPYGETFPSEKMGSDPIEKLLAKKKKFSILVRHVADSIPRVKHIVLNLQGGRKKMMCSAEKKVMHEGKRREGTPGP